MPIHNFTASDIWKQSNKIRFDVKNVVTLNNVDFLIKENEIQCLQFFDVDFSDNLLKLLKSSIVNDKKIIFKYINLSNQQLAKLKLWCEQNNLQFIINDEWDNPTLKLTEKNLNAYISTKSYALKRDYSKYLSDKLIEYKVFNNNNLKLWTDVLAIDKNSWKGDTLCDMKSLAREDLQYIFYLLNLKENSSLMVSYVEGVPMSYSLWFKGDDDLWYAAKWGASTEGRKYEAGIKVLFNHLNFMLKQQNGLNIDFWARRSRFYDMLKNGEFKRYHFEIRKKYE